MQVVIDLDTRSVLQDLGELADRVGGGLGADFAGPAVSMEIAAIEREWFASQGEGSWPPLAASTLVARANRSGYYASAPAAGVGATGPILVWSGRLRESLGDPRGRGAPDAFIKMSPDELEQGTLVPYALYHQGPGARTRRDPVKELTPEDEERLVQAMLRFVEDGV